MVSDVRVAEAHEVSDQLVASLGRLVGQLSAASPAPSRAKLEEIVASPTTRLLIASETHGAIVGMLTLAVFRIPTGVRAWIEDVVVDERAQGRGVAELLARDALRLAHEHGARTVDLTSRPSREAANRLYEKAGFARRETNVWRFTE
ncbi:MAG: GNAT family N-acetyltransferase [Solirubrobacteraceae bacterium]